MLASVAIFAWAADASTRADEKVSLRVAHEKPYGAMLTDSAGRAFYLFTADKGQAGSTCYEACAKAWPPLLADGKVSLAAPELKDERP